MSTPVTRWDGQVLPSLLLDPDATVGGLREERGPLGEEDLLVRKDGRNAGRHS